MTTGTQTVDQRTTVSTTCGSVLAGYFRTRTWSGSDYPPRAIAHNVWVKPRVISQLRIPEQLGKSGLSSTYSRSYDRFLVEGHYKTVWKKSPKRTTIEYHPYTSSWVEQYDPLMQFDNYPGDLANTGTVAGCFGFTETPDPWTANDTIAILGKLRVATVGSDFHAGNFLGEGRQCLQMIGDTATRVAKSLRYIKRGNVSRAVRVLFGTGVSDKEILARKAEFYRKHRVLNSSQSRKTIQKVDGTLSDLEVGNLWLSIQYGWLPLLEDAHSAAGMLAHLLNDPLQFRVRVNRHAGGMRNQTPRVGLYRPVLHTVTSSTSILAILSEKDVAQLSGLTDPLSIAWEVVPYSFVVDWFMPIGNWLQARGMASALTGKFVVSHKFVEIQRTLEHGNKWAGGYNVKSPLFFRSRGTMSRSVSTTLEVPFPVVKPLGKSLSWLHCTNAVALLSQFGKSGWRP